MQKFLLMVCGCIFAMTKSAYAASCQTLPSCDDLGYVDSEEECPNGDFVRCPVDESKVFCLSYTGCKVGSILYDDFMCYRNPPEGKTPIAVVFDTEDRLAVSLNYVSSQDVTWGPNSAIDGLYNCYDYNCGKDGAYNTMIITYQLSKEKTYSDIKKYAAPYCYYSTEGDVLEGSWFLPSMYQLKSLCDNKDVVNETMKEVAGTELGGSGQSDLLSSNEQSELAGKYRMNTIGISDCDFRPADKDVSSNIVGVRCVISY